MENTLIRMSEADYAAFVEVIVAPAAPVPALLELSRREAPWERVRQVTDHGSNDGTSAPPPDFSSPMPAPDGLPKNTGMSSKKLYNCPVQVAPMEAHYHDD